MSDMLGIGSSAVQAYQTALATVANNVANMNTTGYTREVVTMEAAGSQAAGTLFLGGGVTVANVERAWSRLAQNNLLSTNGSLGTQTPLVKHANEVINLIGDSQAGLNTALDTFFNAAQALSAAPGDTALRSQYLAGAGTLAASLRNLSAQLSGIEQGTRGEISDGVTQVNTIAAALAQVNTQLAARTSAADQPPALLDKRDQLLGDLSKLAGIHVDYALNGMVNVGIGQSATQGPVVVGVESRPLSAVMSETAAGKVDFQLTIKGEDQPLTSLASGSLAGLAAFRQQVLEPVQSGLDMIAGTLGGAVNDLQTSGIDANGDTGKPIFAFSNTPGVSAAAGIGVAFDDPRKVAAGSLFRGIASAANLGSALARVSWQAPASAPAGPTTIDRLLGSNPTSNPGSDIAVSAAGTVQAVATIPAGYTNTSLFLATSPASGLDLRIFTRDGTQLLGPALSAADQAALVANPANGFAPGTVVPLNNVATPGGTRYQGLSLTYGARAEVLGNPPAAELRSAALPQSGDGSIAAGALSINGFTLPGSFAPPPDAAGNGASAAALAAWIQNSLDGATPPLSPPVSVSASNTLTLAADSLQLDSDVPFSINGEQITPPTGGYASVSDLANAINSLTQTTGVAAITDARGGLTLTSIQDPASGQWSEGRDFIIGNPSFSSRRGALGLGVPAAGLTVRGTLSLQSAAAISVNGSASDLARLGLRAEARISGTLPEDLLVFAAAPAGTSGIGTVAASYTPGSIDPVEASRARPLTIAFTSASTYTITDATSGQLLATRNDYVPGGSIHYGGLAVSFSVAAQSGDSFRIDGNQDGTGDNANMRAVAALQTARTLFPRSQTPADAYNGIVAAASQVASQASLAQQALSVVNQQAIQAVDAVSGVNMNTEAADLIRFQQAYQAAAKSIETSNQLFDTIVQMRV
jgi:flagellar hook-associated protein FlgK